MDALFFLNSILLGIGLAMDAFSVSVANAIGDPRMSRGRMNLTTGVFAGFQFLMPMAGWICVHEILAAFTAFGRLIPWIALALLSVIGVKMILEGLRPEEEEGGVSGGRTGFGTLLIQGVATSIDALSVGFTIASYDAAKAVLSSSIIGAVTFAICMTGLLIGKKIGARIGGRARIAGGLILLGIGIEIFARGML